MEPSAATITPPVYAITHPPLRRVGFIYNSPHSGAWYPPDLLETSRLSLNALRSSEDCFVDHLFSMAPSLGAPLLRVNVARTYIDTNREPYELDAGMLLGPLPLEANTDSERVQAGLGTIPRIVTGNQKIYAERFPVSEALHRISTFYMPIHKALAELIEATRAAFGHAVLIDCHSMPSGTTFPRQPLRPGADIVLGDRHGTSCCPDLIATAESWLRSAGYRVVRNRPYSGGYNTQHYGRPQLGIHALQIEINRGLYMNELKFEPTAGMAPLMRDLKLLMENLHALPADLFLPATDANRTTSFQQSAE